MSFILNSLASWKTTAAGVVGIAVILNKWVQAGHVDFNDMNQIWMLVMSLGLVAAKDNNVTGSR